MVLSPRHSRILIAVVLALVLPRAAAAQYFGQNKVQYDQFEFKVLATPHFDIYHYPEEAEAAQQVARMAERWDARLTRVFGYQLTGRQAVVLYASHPEFEQTNVVEGALDEATGGVTESGRRRIVLPLAASLGETDHVLGHELVHAFQYDLLGRAAEGMPLWFMEGMAEYLSLGPTHAPTAMWLRDAALADRLPSIEDLQDPRYFPYRFGHAFWAYVAGRWGDRTIGTIVESIARNSQGSTGGMNPVTAIELATGMKEEALSAAWQQAIRTAYDISPRDKAAPKVAPGEVVIGERAGGGQMNVGPSLSPDGRRIAFLSERSRLAIDLYVADAVTGRVEKKLTKTEADPHFESLQFLASAGTWSPDSKQLAVAAVRRGRPVVAFFDVDRGELTREISFSQRGEIFQPSWSPDGKTLAFSAQVGGFTDLYLLDIAAEEIRQLTKDAAADLQPTWSPDGRSIAFVTDRATSNDRDLKFGTYGVAVIQPDNGRITQIETGTNGNDTNPQWSGDGRTLFFLSDGAGRSDIYRVNATGGVAAQITNEPTGVSGITGLSPAFSVSPASDRIAFNVFRDGGYEIQFLSAATTARAISAEDRRSSLAELPPLRREAGVVAEQLSDPRLGLPDQQTFPQEPYKSGFKLIDIGQQIGATSTSGFGTYVSGGVSMLFSDVLGNHLLSTAVDVNGGVKDFATQVAYINRTSRWNWGVFGDRVPLLSATITGLDQTVINGQSVIVQETALDRQTASELGAFVAYPFSRASRLEFSASAQHIGFSREIETGIFDPFTGDLLDRTTSDRSSFPGLNLAQVGTAFVRDTAVSGATSPILGQRLRLEVAPGFGDLRMTNVTMDVRQYAMPARPVTFAARALHVGRYGAGGEDARLNPLFLGYSTLVRGYDPGSFQASECGNAINTCPALDRLVGSRLLVVNLEARVPIGGLFTGNLDYGPVPTELFAFLDGGVAWTRSLKPTFAGGTRDWARTVGVGARVNLFGFAIGEFNLARPLDRPGRGWTFVFNLRPGF